jgi:hypothetical protein
VDPGILMDWEGNMSIMSTWYLETGNHFQNGVGNTKGKKYRTYCNNILNNENNDIHEIDIILPLAQSLQSLPPT